MIKPYLFRVPASHIDAAWRDGAHQLSAAVERAAREITPDQLKMILSRGERMLLGLRDAATQDKPAAWAVVSVQQMPNIRVLYVYAIFAPGSTGPECMAQMSEFARQEGCSVIRGACDEAVQRLWERRFGARRVYATMEIELQEAAP